MNHAGEDDYVEPLSPEQVEAAINQVRQNISRGVRIVSAAEREARAAAAAFDRAYAHAYLDHPGPAHEKRYAAEVDPGVVRARDARDVAQLAYRHAERVADALQAELRAYQSINKSVTSMYGAETGVGR